MGPLELTDMIGQDVNFAVTCSVFNAFWQERRFLPSLVQQELVLAGRLGKKSGKGVYDWQGEKPDVQWVASVNDTYSPMRVEKRRDGVTEIDDVYLIETQGETAQALALRLNGPVVVVDRIERDVAVIAAAASNPHTATQKAIRYLQQQGLRVVQKDAFALRSQQRTAQAQQNGILAQEIVPVPVPGKKGTVTAFSVDEHPRANTTLEQLAGLKTPFRKNGVVTAGNASGVNDGAAALIVASEKMALAQGVVPRTRIVAMATAGVEPRLMGLGPVPATRRVLERAGLSIHDMDVIELNEAFAAQALGVLRQLGLQDDAAHVNPNGGAIALGHPLGMSGARLALAASNELHRRGGRYALCTMCIGVGQGIAMILERV